MSKYVCSKKFSQGYFNENNLNVNYVKSNCIHFKSSINEKDSLNCLLNKYVVSETNHNLKIFAINNSRTYELCMKETFYWQFCT